MNAQRSISSVAALVHSTAAAETPSPSSIPPGPQSGVILLEPPTRSPSSAPSAALCATFWPRAEAGATLRAAVLERGPRALRHLTRRAEWDFATALRAYAKARGRAPSVLAGQRCASSASSASEES
jgi:hypothetical protein